MAISNDSPDAMKANSVTAGTAVPVKPPPLEDFNDALQSIRHVNSRFESLLLMIKGQDCKICEDPEYFQNVQALLTSMPTVIRGECNVLAARIDEFEQIIFS